MADPTTQAYMAGFMDGEGSFSIVQVSSKSRSKNPAKADKRNYVYHLHVKIANTSLSALQWVQTNFGGQLGEKKKWNAKWKRRYDWTITGYDKIAAFIRQIYPYLVIKKKQAEVALDYCALNGKVCPPERARLREIMLNLNNSKQPHDRTGALEANTPDCPNNGQVIESELYGDIQSDLVVTQEEAFASLSF